MKTKSDNPFFTKNWTANFIANLLGVIVGIILTFGVSYLIQRHNEKKQIHEIMILLRKEINNNKEEFAKIREDFRQTQQAYGILLMSDWKTLPADSLNKHMFNARKVTSYSISYTTWNMFQQSDVIKNFADKEVILTVSDLYWLFSSIEKWWNTYSEEKIVVTAARASGNNQHEYIDALLSITNVRSFMEDIYKYEKYNFEEPFQETIDYADYTLFLIDKSGNYEYKFKDTKKEFEQFLEKKHQGSEAK